MPKGFCLLFGVLFYHDFADGGAAANDVKTVLGVGHAYALKIEVFGSGVVLNFEVLYCASAVCGNFDVVDEPAHCACGGPLLVAVADGNLVAGLEVAEGYGCIYPGVGGIVFAHIFRNFNNLIADHYNKFRGIPFAGTLTLGAPVESKGYVVETGGKGGEYQTGLIAGEAEFQIVALQICLSLRFAFVFAIGMHGNEFIALGEKSVVSGHFVNLVGAELLCCGVGIVGLYGLAGGFLA